MELITARGIIVAGQNLVDVQDLDRVTADDDRDPGNAGEEAHHGDFLSLAPSYAEISFGLEVSNNTVKQRR